MRQIVMTPKQERIRVEPCVSIAMFAWNEERALRATLESLFAQSLFEHLDKRGACCEVVCVANGCTDRTPEVAAELFRELTSHHPHRGAITAHVANIVEQGKVNAWNQYVHQVSPLSARVLFMMDADILIHRKETLENMLATLEAVPEATVAVDVPCKHIAQKNKTSIGDKLSLAAARMTLASEGQLCGQLYAIRTEAARNIYIPKELSACEDGLIKVFVCTDSLSHPSWSKRIRVAPNAEHTFEAYTTPRAIIKNQKRQIMGQTMVHVLVDKFLSSCSAEERRNLGPFLRSKDLSDPSWLKRLVREHLQQTRYFWRLYPDLAGNRFRRLRKLRPAARLACLPAAIAGTCATLLSGFLAYRALKRGSMTYWPKAQRAGLKHQSEGSAHSPGLNPVSLGPIGGTK